MARNLVLLIDASANLTVYRSEIVKSCVRALLANMRDPQNFSLVTFNEQIQGYQAGTPQPPAHQEEALGWLDTVVGSQRADLTILLERVVQLPDPTDVILFACGFLEPGERLLDLVSQGPQSQRLFSVAVDCECSLLVPLSQRGRGKSFQCHYKDWQLSLHSLLREVKPRAAEPARDKSLAAALAASSSLIRRGDFTTLRLEGPEGLALLSGRGPTGVYQEFPGNADSSYGGHPVKAWKLGLSVRAGHGLVHGYCKIWVGEGWTHLAFHHLPLLEYDEQGELLGMPESPSVPLIEVKRAELPQARARVAQAASAEPKDWI